MSNGDTFGPLSGIRVIELAGMGPVPFCGMLLGDMGADVLRIDRVEPSGNGIDMSERFDLRGRNKRSAKINLKSPKGREIFMRLVGGADILLEGFRPGVVERLGIGPDDCFAVRSQLVYGRATGFGQDGVLAQSAGHDINYIALTGALAMIGQKDGPPTPPLNLVGDYGGGALYLAFGVMCALQEARRAGKGQVVDAAMVDGVTSLLAIFHGLRQAGQLSGPRGTNVLDGGAPYYTTYETRDGQHVAVGALESRFYEILLERLELDPADIPNRADRSRWPELRSAIADRFRKRTRDDWIQVFKDSDACVTPVLSLEEAEQYSHNRTRELFIDFAGLKHPAPAPRLKRTPGELRRPPAIAGADTIEALSDWGIEESEIVSGLDENILAISQRAKREATSLAGANHGQAL